AVVVVPQERKPGRGSRWLARPQDCDRAARQRDARALAGTDQAYRDGAADRRTAGARPARSRGKAHGRRDRCRVPDERMGRAGDTAGPRRRARCAFRLSPRRREYFLHDYFPFWMAALLGKLIILLIPILGLLYPMMRFLPGLYDWAMRSKVLRMY